MKIFVLHANAHQGISTLEKALKNQLVNIIPLVYISQPSSLAISELTQWVQQGNSHGVCVWDPKPEYLLTKANLIFNLQATETNTETWYGTIAQGDQQPLGVTELFCPGVHG